jgi:hypothetical protein
MSKKAPQIGETVFLGAKVSPTKITAVYDGTEVLAGDKNAYSVKTTSGDVYLVIDGGQGWAAIK